MDSYSQVESTLKEVLEVIKPLRDDWITRFKIIDELREVAQSMESFRGATVEPFGSFVSNLFTRWGDLDISIELPYGSFVSSAGKKRKQSLLGELLKALRQKGGWLRLQFVPHARVPILKILTKPNISCDISIDNLPCQMKSKFLFWLSEIDGRFRDMVLLVKEWAKANGINNPKTGTFNSFSLSLLVIFHFQTCVPAILPPLKEIYPANVVDDLTGVRADAERRIAQVCSSNIARFRSCRTLNRSSLSELFISFIAKVLVPLMKVKIFFKMFDNEFCNRFSLGAPYWFIQFSDINLKASELGICPFTGQWEYITSNTRWLPRTYAIFVEDPFEQPENAARAVSQKQLVRISEAFERTRRVLISADLTRNTLLSTLVGQQAFQFIVKESANYLSNNGVQYLNMHPQVNGAVHSPLQMQWHQYQKTRQATSQMQRQAPKMMMPLTSKVQSQFQNTRSETRTRLQHHQSRNLKPSVSEVQPQFRKARLEGYPVNFAPQRPFQIQHNQGQMWRPKSEK